LQPQEIGKTGVLYRPQAWGAYIKQKPMKDAENRGGENRPSNRKKSTIRLAKCLTCASTLTDLQDGFDGFRKSTLYQAMPVACIKAVHAIWVDF